MTRMLAVLFTAFLLPASAWQQSPAADFFKRGNDYFNKGDYAHAIEAYTTSISLDPSSARAFYARGIAYHQNHDGDRAIVDYTDAIRLEPGYADAFHERAYAYEDKDDYAHAIQDHTQAIRLKPADVTLVYDRAFDYERTGQYQLAIADFDGILRRFPKAADAYRSRGRVWLYSGHPPEAQLDLSRAVELNPNGAYNVIWLYIARSKGATGAEDELSKNAAKLNLAKWPGPVIDLFLGKSTPETVLRAASDKDPLKNAAQECEANFYIAEHQALHGQRSAAMQGFRTVSENCSKNYFFYVPAAKAELANKP
jgi:lipoprotein NlpI